MEVNPFIGVDGLVFGMSRKAVAVVLGPPGSQRRESCGDEIWDYAQLGLTCGFADDDEYLLGSITLRTSEARFHGVSLVEVPERELVRLGKSGLLPGLLLEEDLPDLQARNYECESLGLGFWVTDGHVQNMTVYPEYDQSGERVLWPRNLGSD